MQEAAGVAVLEEPAEVAAAVDPVRSRLLAALAAEPRSGAAVAGALGLPRQRLGHHLRTLEERGLVVEVGQRRHGGLTERILSASAASYVVSPAALGGAGVDPARVRDRLSAAYAVAVAARLVREVGELLRGAATANKRLPTLAIDTDIRFGSAADRARFAEDLAATIRILASRYHDESAPGGRWYRVAALSHPRPRPEEDQA